MHNAVQVLAPDVSSTFCFDIAQANQTRKEFLSQAISERAVIFTAHFDKTSAGKIQQTAEGNEWVYLEPTDKK